MFHNPLTTFFLGIICALFLQGLHIVIVWFLSRPLAKMNLRDYARGLERYIHKKRDPENEQYTHWLEQVQKYRSELETIQQKLQEISQEAGYTLKV